jgi:hypothetical protein
MAPVTISGIRKIKFKGEKTMGRNVIQRTFTLSTIKSSKVLVVDSKVVTMENDPITVNGEVDTVKALKVVQSTYGKADHHIVMEVTTTTDTHEISFDDFIKYGTKTTKQEV